MRPFQPCGTFPEPDRPNPGKCFPYRVKRPCDAPIIPSPPCDDNDFSIEYDPETGQFRALAKIFDTECLPILDTLGLPITGPTS